MTDVIFQELWTNALQSECREVYVSDWAMSSIWGHAEVDDDVISQRAITCGKIWDAAHRTIQEIRQEAGLTQAAFARRFCVPLRTVEGWCGGHRTPTDYDRLMIQRLLGLL